MPNRLSPNRRSLGPPISRALAFTLIELLIVVAIVATLAAIAVPHYLDAQVRSKVSRAKADLRSLTTALEAYRVDNNDYPPNNALNPADPQGLLFDTKAMVVPLSTPVAYITTSQLPDVFGNEAHPNDEWILVYTHLSVDEGLLSIIYPAIGMTPDVVNRVAEQQYYVYSVGPDRVSIYEQCLRANGGNQGLAMVASVNAFVNGEFVYDPTNGTLGTGDIARSAKGFINKAL